MQKDDDVPQTLADAQQPYELDLIPCGCRQHVLELCHGIAAVLGLRRMKGIPSHRAAAIGAGHASRPDESAKGVGEGIRRTKGFALQKGLV